MILDKDRNPYRIYGNHREITERLDNHEKLAKGTRNP
nr:MAG TPA: hypothetical protein [Caudoviricetes sp.]